MLRTDAPLLPTLQAARVRNLLQSELRDLLDAPTALAACCGFDLCHKYILYLYLYLYFGAACAERAGPPLRCRYPPSAMELCTLVMVAWRGLVRISVPAVVAKNTITRYQMHVFHCARAKTTKTRNIRVRPLQPHHDAGGLQVKPGGGGGVGGGGRVHPIATVPITRGYSSCTVYIYLRTVRSHECRIDGEKQGRT